MRKPIFRVAFLAASIMLALVALPRPSQAEGAPDAERARIEAIVKDYLLAHPEVVVDALGEFEKRQKAEDQRQASAAIVDNRAQLISEKGGGVAGNPKGDVTLVEFFDYRCGYCRQAKPMVADLLKAEPGLRLVYKEFPILGPDSLAAARAALAARKQGTDKYVPFHGALMNTRGTLDEAAIRAAARSVGLDADKLMRDAADPAIDQELKDNHALAAKLGINGTPSFVIGNNLLPGVGDLAELRRLVADARATCKGSC